ncbi:MAG: hypothetical protein AAB834_00845, partial [Patescibacteria group bacterium]
KHALSRVVQLDPGSVPHLHRWYDAANRVAEIFGPDANFRWEQTPVGNPYAHDNGSGPHDRVMKSAIEDPESFPPYKTYEWKIVPHSILGRPDTDLLAIGDPGAIRRVTVGNHAGGGATQAVLEGEADLKRAAPAVIERARHNFELYKRAVIGRVASGTLLVAA